MGVDCCTEGDKIMAMKHWLSSQTIIIVRIMENDGHDDSVKWLRR